MCVYICIYTIEERKKKKIISDTDKVKRTEKGNGTKSKKRLRKTKRRNRNGKLNVTKKTRETVELD